MNDAGFSPKEMREWIAREEWAMYHEPMSESDELTILEGNTPAPNAPSLTTYQNPSAAEWREDDERMTDEYATPDDYGTLIYVDFDG